MFIDFLIIGAGPFGFSMASYCESRGINYQIVGKPMSFWKEHMPRGMVLRSDCNWHLDPQNIYTIDKYLETRGLTRNDVEPLSLDFYLGYTDWFREQVRVKIQESMVTRLDSLDDKNARFKATLDNGSEVTAKNVLLAIGFQYFTNNPADLIQQIPKGRWTHTCDMVDLGKLKDKKVLIIGGRQSAYEWAALIAEEGASEVHVSHRHEAPDFTESEWTWINSYLDNMVTDPMDHINMHPDDRQSLDKRFWVEGRLKLEPWLAPRLDKGSVNVWPESEIFSCTENPEGELKVQFKDSETITVDHVVLATGYKVNIKNVPFLKAGNIFQKLKTDEGYPVLDERLQTSVPGLFATSMAATMRFGLFFAFTSSARASANIIGPAIA